MCDVVSGRISEDRGADCGSGSCLSGGLYSSCGIKYGSKGSGHRGGSGRGNEGDRGGGSMCDDLSFCHCLRTVTMITSTSVPEVKFVLCTSE